MSALGSLFEMSIFFCFSPNKGHKRHGVQSCCDLPKHFEQLGDILIIERT
jgi:hypothetical protein